MDYLEYQGWNPVIVRIEENGQILGFFIGAKIKHLLSIIASPFEGTGTAHQGLSMLIKIPNETRIEIYRQLAPWIFENKIGDYLQIEDWQLRMEDVDENLDIYTEPHRVMYIDLSIPEDDLYHNMHEDCRYSIRKSLKNGLIVKEATDVNVFLDAFYEQYKEVYAKRGDVAPKSKQNIANLIRCLYPNHVLLLETVTKEGEIAATGIIPLGSNYASTWQTASYRRLQKLRPNEILRWEAMRLSKERGIMTLNMCGTPAFKEKFGTQLVLCPRLIFCRYAIIIKLKTMTKRIYYKLRRTPIINKLL